MKKPTKPKLIRPDLSTSCLSERTASSCVSDVTDGVLVSCKHSQVLDNCESVPSSKNQELEATDHLDIASSSASHNSVHVNAPKTQDTVVADTHKSGNLFDESDITVVGTYSSGEIADKLIQNETCDSAVSFNKVHDCLEHLEKGTIDYVQALVQSAIDGTPDEIVDNMASASMSEENSVSNQNFIPESVIPSFDKSVASLPGNAVNFISESVSPSFTNASDVQIPKEGSDILQVKIDKNEKFPQFNNVLSYFISEDVINDANTEVVMMITDTDAEELMDSDDDQMISKKRDKFATEKNCTGINSSKMHYKVSCTICVFHEAVDEL